MQVALKCADLGHLASPRLVHRRWVQHLEEEFFRQGDREKAMVLAVSPLMDRDKNGITKSQVRGLPHSCVQSSNRVPTLSISCASKIAVGMSCVCHVVLVLIHVIKVD